MGIVLLFIFGGYCLIASITFALTLKFVKSKMLVTLVGVALILFPFKHWLFYGALYGIYGLWPLQEINETVEKPISVYWEDNVWPDFDQYSSDWMVRNYLDGIHLKTLALGSEGGQIAIYHADESSRAESTVLKKKISEIERKIEEVRLENSKIYKKTGKRDPQLIYKEEKELLPIVYRMRRDYDLITKKEIRRITDNARIVSSVIELPPMQYRVELYPIHRFFPATKLYHADLIEITELKGNRIIGYSKRFMAYAPWIFRISGKQPKFGESKGDQSVYQFDDKVLFQYAAVNNDLESMKSGLRRKSYNLRLVNWER